VSLRIREISGRSVFMAYKWKKIYVITAVLLSVSVIGMVVSGGNGPFPWFVPAMLFAIICIVARMKMREKSRR
jgi:hypothetical protein